jgi:hypothetical protein
LVSKSTGGEIMSRPVLNADNSLVILASADGYAYAIDISAVEPGSDAVYPRLAWRFRTGHPTGTASPTASSTMKSTMKSAASTSTSGHGGHDGRRLRDGLHGRGLLDSAPGDVALSGHRTESPDPAWSGEEATMPSVDVHSGENQGTVFVASTDGVMYAIREGGECSQYPTTPAPTVSSQIVVILHRIRPSLTTGLAIPPLVRLIFAPGPTHCQHNACTHA